MKLTFVAILPLLLLTACSANKVGIEGYTQFQQRSYLETVASQKDYNDFARCFEQNAKLFPLTQVKYIPARQEAVYEMAGYGWWFETVRFAPQPGGSVAEIRLAANYDEKWMKSFRQDRYTAILNCQ